MVVASLQVFTSLSVGGKKVLEKVDTIWDGSKVIFPCGQVMDEIIFLLVVEDVSSLKAVNGSLFSSSAQKTPANILF